MISSSFSRLAALFTDMHQREPVLKIENERGDHEDRRKRVSGKGVLRKEKTRRQY